MNLIFKEPKQFGLRGDPYLWEELKTIFEQCRIENKTEFEEFLYDNFERIVGSPIVKSKIYSVPRYRFGGMSAGAVYCDFWLEKGFPILIRQFADVKKNFY